MRKIIYIFTWLAGLPIVIICSIIYGPIVYTRAFRRAAALARQSGPRGPTLAPHINCSNSPPCAASTTLLQ